MKTKIFSLVLSMAFIASGTGLAEPKYKSIFFSDEAEKYLEKWESDKSWSDAIVEADALYKKRQWAAAASRYAAAISQGYRQPQGMFNLAHCEDALGERDKAIGHYQRAAKELDSRGLKNAMLFECHYRLGVLYGEKKDLAQSLSHLEKARALQSNNTDLLFSLGVVYHKMGNAAEAEKFYQACLGIDPNFAEAGKNLAKLQQSRDLPMDLTEALKRNHLPGKIPLEIVRLETLDAKTVNEKIGQLQARLALEKDKKGRGQLHHELGLYLATAKDYQKALDHMEEARRLGVKSSSFVVGYIYYKTKQTEKALQYYGRFVRQQPKDPLGHYNLAVLYDNQTKKIAKAMHHYRRYLQLSRENARDADLVGRRVWLLSHVRNP